MIKSDEISVCICTCRRPVELDRCISSILNVYNRFPGFELIVVDNDPGKSAKTVVDGFVESSDARIKYISEGRVGISYARNRCVAEALGSWIAFVDDDEWVDVDWLENLIISAVQYRADAVFGPVLPSYADDPPNWVKLGRVHQRPRYKTGSRMKWGDCRCGNVLFRKALFHKIGNFNADFALTGGEDCEFFLRAANLGFVLVWSDESVVHEIVPAVRMTRRWVLKRVYIGAQSFVRIRSIHFGSAYRFFDAAWGLGGVFLYSLPSFIYLLFGSNRSIFYERKFFASLGKLASLFILSKGEYGVR